MFNVISDKNNIMAVFQSYSITQALEVKYNVQTVLANLNIPSAELLAKMQAEGLSLDDFDSQPKRADQQNADSVLRSHLKPLFLDFAHLNEVISSLSIKQAIAVRDILSAMLPHLKLPSESLLAEMEKEGLSLHKLGVKNSAPQATVSNSKIAQTKSLLGQALQQDSTTLSLQQQVAAAKAKMQSQTDQQAIARKKALLGSALAEPALSSNVTPIKAACELSLVKSNEEQSDQHSKASQQEAADSSLAC